MVYNLNYFFSVRKFFEQVKLHLLSIISFRNIIENRFLSCVLNLKIFFYYIFFLLIPLGITSLAKKEYLKFLTIN
jgi:hypothetical protein